MAFSFTVSPRTLSVGDTLRVRMADYGSHEVLVVIRQQDGGGRAVHSGWFPPAIVQEGEDLNSYYVRAAESWFDGLNATPGTFLVCALLDGEEVIGETPPAVSVSVAASAGMRGPAVGALSFQPVQPPSLPESYAESYIASLTGVKAEAAVSLRFPAAGETLQSVVLSWPGGAGVSAEYNESTGKYEAVAPPVTENTAFTMTATDSRGRYAASSKTLTGVLPYTLPTVTVQELGRCDGEGNLIEGGAYCRLRAAANIFTGLEGNRVTKFTAKIGDGQESGITSGVTFVLGGGLDANSAYTLTLTVQDAVSGEVRRAFRLAGRLRDLVLRRGVNGAHLGVGLAPVPQAGISTLQLPAGGKLLIDGADVLAALAAQLGDVESVLEAVVNTEGGGA